MFRLESVCKSYGSRNVVEIPGCVFTRGLIHGIMGPSGSGKSTLLRLLNMIEKPTAGQIIFRGHDLVTCRPRLSLQRRMVMVFQKPVLFEASVYENVAYGLKVRGLQRADVREKVLEALKTVGLVHLERQPARTLSGGEAQRVAIARAFVTEPEVLLLDEPTSNLDPQNVGMIEDLVRMINRERQTTVILVTHNVFQARRLADHITFMYEGKVVEDGPTEAVFTSPGDDRTRAFIHGDMVY